VEDTPQHIKNGADPGSPSRHLHSSPLRFLSTTRVSRIACGANLAAVLFCGTHRRFPENDRDEVFA
jgi:hypothetical protein